MDDNNMKKILYLFFLLLFTQNCAIAQNTFVYGGNVDGSGKRGPDRDGSQTYTYSTGNTLVFSRTSTLAPANIKLDLGGAYWRGATVGLLYCTRSSKGSGGPLTITSGIVDSGYSYGGHKLFKTNLTGLYYTFHVTELHGFHVSSNITEFYLGEQNSLNVTLTDDYGWCNNSSTGKTPEYVDTQGALSLMGQIEFFTDATFDPAGGESITLLTTEDYVFRVKNENPGSGISSYNDKIITNLVGVNVTLPTCMTTPVLSGSTVSGSTVKLGSYSPNSIINGATPVQFAIELQNCIRIHNIEVKMASSVTGVDTSLLGNTIASNAAQGVGVEISGLANAVSPQMVLIPNDSNSIYKDYEDEEAGSNGIYGDGGSGSTTSQTLHFQALLKRDGNSTITSGEFKATSVLTISYP
ncbi:fimbrial protein [Salmonella enterica]|nr:fimbrial-like adhesin [Salmonella enterica subsp. enterica serovar Chicago]EGK1878018.1 fimbrial protein [Salmonella enterica]